MRIAPEHATTPDVFCAALKRTREARCLTLREISDSTKIAVTHLAALERGDLRHWPKGIYRKAYFRDYARVVGLDADALGRFLQLFPDSDGPDALSGRASSERQQHPHGTAELRLVLDADTSQLGRRHRLIAVIDLLIMLLLSLKVRLGAPRLLPQPRATAEELVEDGGPEYFPPPSTLRPPRSS